MDEMTWDYAVNIEGLGLICGVVGFDDVLEESRAY
jgi:hypothetical protein